MPSFVLDHRERFSNKHAGSVSFYQFRDSFRQPVFLERNLATVVKHHRRQTQAARSNHQTMVPPGRIQAAPGKAAIVREWDPKEILQIIDENGFSDNNPHLRIDVKAIKDRRKTFKLATPVTTPERPSKQARREVIRAICALTIWEGSGPEILVQDQVYCSITPEPNTITGERFAKIDLDEPLTVQPQDLAPKGQKGSTAIRYSMQITLQAASLSDKWPPVDLSNVPAPEMKHQETAEGGLDIFPIFVVSYSRLPHVPMKEDEALWPVKVLQDYKSYLPKLSLYVDSRWVELATPLQSLNSKKQKRKTKAKAETLGGAGENDEQEIPTPLNVETTWEIRDDLLAAHEVETTVFAGYVCPLCNNRLFAGSDIYWFHLIHSHDHFKFRITSRFPESDADEGLIRVRVRFSLKDATHGSRREEWDREPKQGPDTWTLQTHKTFLDLDQYLKADEEKHWNGKPSRKTTSNETPQSGLDLPRQQPVLRDLTRPAHLVPDLPEPRRKKFAVPSAPEGVTFFTLRVKRPLKQGELLSESDDDMDDEWAVQKHMDRIDGFKSQSLLEKRFQKRHDKHMLRENINSNLHYRDALVRFCRANSAWLREPAMRLEFAKKLASLQLESVIKVQQVFEYMQIIDAPLRRAKSDNEDKEQGEDTQRPRPEAGPLYAICAACSDPIRSIKDMVRCTNPTCTRDFHRRCPDIMDHTSARDISAWRCPMCAKQPALEVKVEGADGSAAMVVDGPARASPHLQILDNFAPDHLSSLPRGHGLGPGENTGRYRRSGQVTGTSFNPISLDGSLDDGRVQDSEADSEDMRSTPDFPVGRDKMRRQLSAGKGDADDRRRASNAEYPGEAWVSEAHRQARYLDPVAKRKNDELARRITDDNGTDWMQKRPVKEGDSTSRPRRPHEL